MRFLLSAGSAFMNAQMLTAASPVRPLRETGRRPLHGQDAGGHWSCQRYRAGDCRGAGRDGAIVIGVDVPQAEEELTCNMRDWVGLHCLWILPAMAPRPCCEISAAAQTSSLHGIVHNAGITRDKMLSRMTEQQWNMLMQVNLGSVQRINAALLETDLLDNGGKIIGVASISGIAGNVGQTNYGFSKSAVLAWWRLWPSPALPEALRSMV